MKYSPKVQAHRVSRNPNIVDVHPLQDPETIQGLLEIYYKANRFMKEISGMDEFCFQNGGGANACFGGASMVRAFHEAQGDSKRDEIVTTMFSHPCDAGAPATEPWGSGRNL